MKVAHNRATSLQLAGMYKESMTEVANLANTPKEWYNNIYGRENRVAVTAMVFTGSARDHLSERKWRERYVENESRCAV